MAGDAAPGSSTSMSCPVAIARHCNPTFRVPSGYSPPMAVKALTYDLRYALRRNVDALGNGSGAGTQ